MLYYSAILEHELQRLAWRRNQGAQLKIDFTIQSVIFIFFVITVTNSTSSTENKMLLRTSLVGSERVSKVLR